LSPKKIHELVTVNLELPMIVTNLFLRTLKKNKGRIINISSACALSASPHGCAYSATKAGLTQFSESLFEEVRKCGVGVSVIHPEMTMTDFYRNADFTTSDDEETYLKVSDVVSAVGYVLDVPARMCIPQLTLIPQKHAIKRKNK
jgi:short-subunit dehydrogenase